MPSRFDPVAFVKLHGVVLASAKGRVPNLAEAVAGEPISGSWWAHPKGKRIFNVLSALDDSPDVLAFRWIDGKITYAHRRVWPAMTRLAREIGASRLAVVRQEHTESGAHRNVVIPHPKWVPKDVAAAARKLTLDQARAILGDALSRRAR